MRGFLQNYLNREFSLGEQLLSPSTSLAHAMWDGSDHLATGMAKASQCIRKVVSQSGEDVQAELLLSVMTELTGQELGCQHLAHRMRLQPRVILELLGAAEMAGLWHHLKCFGRPDDLVNKRSKGYIADVSLACQIFNIAEPAMMNQHRSWGALFETFIVNLLIKQLPSEVAIFYWRTADGGAEVDIVLQRGRTLYPIEVKGAVHVSESNARKIAIFGRYYEGDYEIAPGLVVYAGQRYYSFNDGVIAVPWSLLADGIVF